MQASTHGQPLLPKACYVLHQRSSKSPTAFYRLLQTPHRQRTLGSALGIAPGTALSALGNALKVTVGECTGATAVCSPPRLRPQRPPQSPTDSYRTRQTPHTQTKNVLECSGDCTGNCLERTGECTHTVCVGEHTGKPPHMLYNQKLSKCER